MTARRLGAAALALASAGLASGCTTVSIARLAEPKPGETSILVTTSGTDRPYQSLGLVQIYRAGFSFGWIAIPGDIELDPVINDYLVPEARRRGADAVINLRFRETNYTPALKSIMTIPPLILLPLLHTSVTLSGELVKFTDRKAPP